MARLTPEELLKRADMSERLNVQHRIEMLSEDGRRMKRHKDLQLGIVTDCDTLLREMMPPGRIVKAPQKRKVQSERIRDLHKAKETAKQRSRRLSVKMRNNKRKLKDLDRTARDITNNLKRISARERRA